MSSAFHLSETLTYFPLVRIYLQHIQWTRPETTETVVGVLLTIFHRLLARTIKTSCSTFWPYKNECFNKWMWRRAQKRNPEFRMRAKSWPIAFLNYWETKTDNRHQLWRVYPGAWHQPQIQMIMWKRWTRYRLEMKVIRITVSNLEESFEFWLNWCWMET